MAFSNRNGGNLDRFSKRLKKKSCTRTLRFRVVRTESHLARRQPGTSLVDSHRKTILIVGPILLIGASFLLTLGSARDGSTAPRTPGSLHVDVVEPLQNDTNSRLRRACEATAQDLIPRLDRSDTILIRPPYVIAGDMPEEVLDRLHRDVIRPTERALNVSFFDTVPTEPITIIAFADEPRFREFALRVDRRKAESYYGYYLRPQRRVVVNVSTGGGTLAHELTHALAHFDFPLMPEWFDEGLASLFEQSEFTDSNHRLTGTDNWRVHHVLRAMHENHLRPTGDLVQGKSVRANNEAIDYAHARYVCLFLQDQQLLEPFYRKLRSRAETDPTGWQTLREIVVCEKAQDLDADFHRWVVKYHKTQRQRTVRRDGQTLSMKPFEPPAETIAADVAK